LPEHNRRFARSAARPEDYHRRRPCATELEKIFRLESERTISDDWVVRYDSRFFQLEPESRHYAPARGQVTVSEAQDGQVSIEYRGRAVPWREIAVPAQPSVSATQRIVEPVAAPTAPVVKRKWVPPADHPWRKAARREAARGALAGPVAAPHASLALSSASP
jgi:hypothetical protein